MDLFALRNRRVRKKKTHTHTHIRPSREVTTDLNKSQELVTNLEFEMRKPKTVCSRTSTEFVYLRLFALYSERSAFALFSWYKRSQCIVDFWSRAGPTEQTSPDLSSPPFRTLHLCLYQSFIPSRIYLHLMLRHLVLYLVQYFWLSSDPTVVMKIHLPLCSFFRLCSSLPDPRHRLPASFAASAAYAASRFGHRGAKLYSAQSPGSRNKWTNPTNKWFESYYYETCSVNQRKTMLITATRSNCEYWVRCDRSKGLRSSFVFCEIIYLARWVACIPKLMDNVDTMGVLSSTMLQIWPECWSATGRRSSKDVANGLCICSRCSVFFFLFVLPVALPNTCLSFKSCARWPGAFLRGPASVAEKAKLAWFVNSAHSLYDV